MIRVALLAALATLAAGCAAAISIQSPRCEYRESPSAIDVPQPRLSWQLASAQRGQGQRAYQILVASTPKLLAADDGDLWDSGRAESDENIQIHYAGQALASRQVCYWKVRVWDRDNHPSAWSDAAQWSTGLLSQGDWIGTWIKQSDGPADRPMPIFRRRFTVDKPLKRAVIYVCGLGQFELHANGQTIGQDILQPGWTNYRKTCLYVAYDLTKSLQQGANAIGVMLGNGMYNMPAQRYRKFNGSFGPPMLIAQLHLDYADGTSQVVATDGAWKVSSGPITFSSIYGGEDYDARLEQPGWDQPNFDDASWSAAAPTPGPGGRLAGDTRSAPPIRAAMVLTPKKVTPLRPNVWVYDLGQNCAMIPRITVRGAAGTKVRITPGELLNRDGSVTQAQSGSPSYYTYTLKGGGPEQWTPRFSYYGARYLQLDGVDPGDVQVEGLFITSSSTPIGEFACSNDLFNRTNQLIIWAMRSNMVSLLTDCPHRERLGWLEQDHLMGPSLMDNFDMAALLSKTCGEMSDAQRGSGLVPDIAPEYVVFKNGFLDSPEWGSACVLIPWSLYRWYGDTAVLRDNYDVMRRYVAYLAGRAKDGIVNYGLGDWFDIGPKRPGIAQLTPLALTATAFYYRDLTILSQAARLLSRDADAYEYARQAEAVRQAFNSAFYDPARHRYASGSQAAQAIPLVFGLNAPGESAAILQSLVDDIRSHDDGLTAGDVGYRYVLRALADGGRSDVIYDMNRRSDRPGYAWQLDHGATSLVEAWNADPRTSQDHFMLGHIMEWFYSGLAGIQNPEDSVAFKRIVIKPAMIGDVTWAKAGYDSIRGKIVSSWRRDGSRTVMDVTIPPGSTAEVYVPAASPDSVTESGRPAADSPGVHFLRLEPSACVFAIESGSYEFAANR